MCRWDKTINGYVTRCGHKPNIMGRGWDYCPYCGEELEKPRAAYLKTYYLKCTKGGQNGKV